MNSPFHSTQQLHAGQHNLLCDQLWLPQEQSKLITCMQQILQLHPHLYYCTYRSIPSQSARLTRFLPIHSPTLLRSPWVEALCKSHENTFSPAIHSSFETFLYLALLCCIITLYRSQNKTIFPYLRNLVLLLIILTKLLRMFLILPKISILWQNCSDRKTSSLLWINTYT